MKKDNSKKGSYDKDIIPLLNLINSKKDYKTTSSCSGRIVLLETTKNKKNTCSWIYKTHTKADYKKIYELQKNKFLWFLTEPFILHIKCKDLNSAKRLLKILNESGLKNSGIISLKNLVIKTEGTEKMHIPLYNNDLDYIKKITKLANQKLNKTKERIKILENKIKKID